MILLKYYFLFLYTTKIVFLNHPFGIYSEIIKRYDLFDVEFSSVFVIRFIITYFYRNKII